MKKKISFQELDHNVYINHIRTPELGETLGIHTRNYKIQITLTILESNVTSHKTTICSMCKQYTIIMSCKRSGLKKLLLKCDPLCEKQPYARGA